jgi:prepilin-type processing-associated H-X9-DG protein
VVLGILSLLMALVLPGLAVARNRADRAQCINNARQVVLAWSLYPDDHGGRLPPNVDGKLGGFTNWVAGHLGDASDATDAALLVDSRRSLLSAYLKEPRVFKCPADESRLARSIGMNCRLNPTRYFGVPPRWVGGLGERYRTFRKVTDIVYPVRIFVTMDESAVSINDAYFAVDMSNTGTSDGSGTERPYYVVDSPAAYHSGGATVSFADGHVFRRKWKDAGALQRLHGPWIRPPNGDMAWLQGHTTYVK